jgi:hypothetical protein
MRYSEITEILPRNQPVDLMNLLSKFSSVIDDAVNFGTNLLKWDAERKLKGDENLLPLLFLRNILELADSISILIKNSSIEACKPLLRSLIENTFGLEYLLEKKTKERALSFIVWQTHKNIKLHEKQDSSTPKGKHFKKELEKDKLLKDATEFFDKPLLKEAIKNARDLLALPKYALIEKEYTSAISTKRNLNWYSLFNGPENIEQLAKYLNRHAFYEIFYRSYSGDVHTTNVFQKKVVHNEDGTASIIQIRYPEEAQSITSNSLNIIFIANTIYYKARLPERKSDFNIWYSELRIPFQELLANKFIKIQE